MHIFQIFRKQLWCLAVRHNWEKNWISLAFASQSGPSWKLFTSLTLTATQVANMKMKKHLNKPGMHMNICSPTKAMQKHSMETQKIIRSPLWRLLFMYTSSSLHIHFRKGAKTCMVSSNYSPRSKHDRINNKGCASINTLKSKYLCLEESQFRETNFLETVLKKGSFMGSFSVWTCNANPCSETVLFGGWLSWSSWKHQQIVAWTFLSAMFHSRTKPWESWSTSNTKQHTHTHTGHRSISWWFVSAKTPRYDTFQRVVQLLHVCSLKSSLWDRRWGSKTHHLCVCVSTLGGTLT